MPYDLLATLIVGAFAAMCTWLLFRIRKRPMPRRLLPVSIGLAMIAYTVWSEYSWGSRTADALPQGVEVIEKIPGRSLWWPWTYAFPSTGRMIAIDVAALRHNPRFPGVVLADVVLLERWLPARRMHRMIDCTEGRTANVTDPAAFADGGVPAAEAWAPLRRDSSLYRAVCAASPSQPQ